MDYLNLITIAMIGALFIILYYKQPVRLHSVFMKAMLEEVRSNQYNVTIQIYNRLPNEIKAKITSDEIITLVAHFMNIIIEILEKNIREGNKK